MQKLSVLAVKEAPLARKTLAAQLNEHTVDFVPDFPNVQHETIDRLTDRIIQRNLEANNGKKTQALQDLKIAEPFTEFTEEFVCGSSEGRFVR